MQSLEALMAPLKKTHKNIPRKAVTRDDPPTGVRIYPAETRNLKLQQDIRKNGVLEPLILSHHPGCSERPPGFVIISGVYRLLATESVYEYATGEKLLPAIYLGPDEGLPYELAYQIGALINFRSDTFTPFEQTRVLVELIRIKLVQQNAQLENRRDRNWHVKLIKAWVHRKRAARPALAAELGLRVEEINQAFDQVLHLVPRLTLESFVNNRLPVLNVRCRYLEIELVGGRFPISAARAVDRIEDREKRYELIDMGVEGASYRTILRQANNLLRNPANKATPLDKELIDKATSVAKRLRSLPALQKQDQLNLDSALQNIDELLTVRD